MRRTTAGTAGRRCSLFVIVWVLQKIYASFPPFLASMAFAIVPLQANRHDPTKKAEAHEGPRLSGSIEGLMSAQRPTRSSVVGAFRRLAAEADLADRVGRALHRGRGRRRRGGGFSRSGRSSLGRSAAAAARRRLDDGAAAGRRRGAAAIAGAAATMAAVPTVAEQAVTAAVAAMATAAARATAIAAAAVAAIAAAAVTRATVAAVASHSLLLTADQSDPDDCEEDRNPKSQSTIHPFPPNKTGPGNPKHPLPSVNQVWSVRDGYSNGGVQIAKLSRTPVILGGVGKFGSLFRLRRICC